MYVHCHHNVKHVNVNKLNTSQSLKLDWDLNSLSVAFFAANDLEMSFM